MGETLQRDEFTLKLLDTKTRAGTREKEGCSEAFPPAGVIIVCILRSCDGLWCEGSLLPFRENPWIEGEGERGDNEQEIVQWGLFKQ